MNEFQLPIFAVFILAFIISLLLNKLSLNFKYFSKQDIDNQKRLSSLKIPTYGGISMSLAFLVSTRLLGKADFEIIQIAIYAVVITFINNLTNNIINSPIFKNAFAIPIIGLNKGSNGFITLKCSFIITLLLL